MTKPAIGTLNIPSKAALIHAHGQPKLSVGLWTLVRSVVYLFCETIEFIHWNQALYTTHSNRGLKLVCEQHFLIFIEYKAYQEVL